MQKKNAFIKLRLYTFEINFTKITTFVVVVVYLVKTTKVCVCVCVCAIRKVFHMSVKRRDKPLKLCVCV